MELVNVFTLKEANDSHEATKYMVEHYKECLKSVPKTVHYDCREDLVHDVYLSFAKDEQEYKGFDASFGDGTMSVAQYVHNRIKSYAKNSKYSGCAMEVKTSSTGDITYMVKTVSLSNDAYNSSVGGEEQEDAFTNAYRNAATADMTSEVEEELSIRDEIEYCIDICELEGFDIIKLLRNREIIGNLVDFSRKPTGLMARITEIARYHTDFALSLASIIEYANKMGDKFDSLLDNVVTT